MKIRALIAILSVLLLIIIAIFLFSIRYVNMSDSIYPKMVSISDKGDTCVYREIIGNSDCIIIYDLFKMRIMKKLYCKGRLDGLALSRNGKCIYYIDQNNIYKYDIDKQIQKIINIGIAQKGLPYRVCTNEDGTIIALVVFMHGVNNKSKIVIYDFKQEKTVNKQNEINGDYPMLTNSGEYMVYSDYHGKVSIFSIKMGDNIKIDNGYNPVINGDGKSIVYVRIDRLVNRTVRQVYMYDLHLGNSKIISKSVTDEKGNKESGYALAPDTIQFQKASYCGLSISNDGKKVLYVSRADNIVKSGNINMMVLPQQPPF